MRRTQLIILAVTLAAAVAILAPALADRAAERGGATGRAERGAESSWPGIAEGGGAKPEGTSIALYGDLALRDRFAIPADAAFGPRDGALELVEAPGAASATRAAAGAPGPLTTRVQQLYRRRVEAEMR